MALQTTAPFQTPYGTMKTDGVYWRWVNLTISVPTQTVSGLLYGYADETAFTQGKMPIGIKQYTVSGADFLSFATQLEPTLSNTFYAYAKAHDTDLTNATEV